MRFPEFTGEWETQIINDVCDKFQSGRFIKANLIKPIGAIPVYGGNGLRGYTDIHNHIGDYVLIGRQGALCGNVRFVSGKTYITEHAIAVKGKETTYTRFLLYLFEKMNLGQFSDQSAQPGLAVNKLQRIKINIPHKNEQKKIAEFLGLLDQRIAVQSKLIEDLQQLKSAICKKLLSHSSWNEYIIDDICDSVSFKEYIAEVEENGSFPIIQQGETPILGYGNKKPYYNYNSVIIFGDHTLSLYKPQVPFLVATDGVKMLSPKPFVTRDFLYYLIETFMPISQGYKRHFSILKEQIIRLPSLKEQTIIGKRLSLLDTKIRIEQQLYDCYISQKQYLLGQMFI